ncbi:MAG: glycosyltransferase, partial [Candidatus Omnitrophica bacterium]|nr:glycosyltransferase [Candidatus Omnitrophota bacterium]
MKRSDPEKVFYIILALYFILHLLLRIFVSTALEKDEAEMVLFFQHGFSPGYSSQPPLYFWLQFIFF